MSTGVDALEWATRSSWHAEMLARELFLEHCAIYFIDSDITSVRRNIRKHAGESVAVYLSRIEKVCNIRYPGRLNCLCWEIATIVTEVIVAEEHLHEIFVE